MAPPLLGVLFGAAAATAALAARRKSEARRPGYEPDQTRPLVEFEAVRDPSGKVIDLAVGFVNPAAARLAGQTPVTGRRLRELLGEGAEPVVREAAVVLAQRAVRIGVAPIGFGLLPVESRGYQMVPSGVDAVLASVDLPVPAVVDEMVLDDARQFRALVEQASDVIAVVGVDGRIRYLSPNAWAVLAQRPERLVGAINIEAIDPAEVGVAAEAFLEALEGGPGKVVTCELTLLGEGNRRTACEVVMTNRTDEPDIGGLIFTMRDISTRRAQDLARRQSEERYRVIVERSAEGIVLLDVAGNVTFANARFAELCGLPVDAVVGRPGLDFVHPVDRQQISEAAAAAYQPQGFSGRVEAQMATADGAHRWVEGSATRLWEGGKFEGLLVVVTDVTTSVAARRALEAREREYRSVLEDATEGLVVTNRARKVVSMSAGLMQRLGLTATEVEGQPIHLRVDPADHATLVAMDRGFRSGERHFDRREIRLLDRSGGQHWMLMSAAARRDPAGDYDGVVALFLDVEEQRAAEESRRDLGAQLVLAAEVERRRLAEDLHDGPVQQLSALALRLGVLAMQSDDTQVRTRAAEAEEVVRSTVTGLRTLMFELVPPDLEGHGLARAIKGAAEVVLTGQQVAIDVHDSVAAKPDVAIQTVAFRIAQEALSNVRNHAHASEVVVDLRDDEGGIRLEISDNGQGVAAARLAESHPGHLGLASVRRRAQEVGGWCEVESEVGLGTTVRAWLPVVP